MEEELNFKDSIKIIFKNLSFEKIFKHVLEELEEIYKERLNNLIDELNKITEELKNKKSNINEKLIIYFEIIIGDLKKINEITDRPYDKYEIEPKLKKIKDEMKELIKISKITKISIAGITSGILVLLGGILTAII